MTREQLRKTGQADMARAMAADAEPVHTKDADCAGHIDPRNGACICGVVHGDPCPDCGGTGFHRQGCGATVGHYRIKILRGHSAHARFLAEIPEADYNLAATVEWPSRPDGERVAVAKWRGRLIFIREIAQRTFGVFALADGAATRPLADL